MRDPSPLLAEHWDITAPVRPLGGGMNSDTWLVRHEAETYVAKLVPPAGRDALVAGSEVAAALADAGFVTGRPVPDRAGRLVGIVSDYPSTPMRVAGIVPPITVGLKLASSVSAFLSRNGIPQHTGGPAGDRSVGEITAAALPSLRAIVCTQRSALAP